MARTPHLALRVDDETKARWEDAATDAGFSLAEYVRDAVDDRVAAEKAPAKPRSKRKTEPRSEPMKTGAPAKTRSGMCPHRIAATSFCKTCDV